MRTLKTTLIIVLALLAVPCISQEDSKSQAFWVHEDVVKPSMISEYETVCKELTDAMKTHNIQEMNSIVANLSDNRYLWVGPIENMAQLDKPLFATLAEKMGADKMGGLFDRMDKCYDIEQNYIIHLDKELSYMPGGITQTPEGQDYRKFHYFHYTPGNRAIVKKKVEDIKNLFTNKGSKLDYRVYRSGFGTRGEFYMVAIAAKDAADYANKISANNELMGEEWLKTYTDFTSTLEKYEAFEGNMRPDMAYAPGE
ncbi:hypothetical protein [Ulvibacterium marinum]|uniref:Uncharacterized protein n=1 Tax=Ulvibacterium marinum TaxID=2419782 RepID=A0A3B0C6A9_9FLAO|nr:hypothetical protein [Ulvibacterium marinum]RKN81683.1 hypothetical protein D7Z94_12330 [Ulvibacterium marinum]